MSKKELEEYRLIAREIEKLEVKLKQNSVSCRVDESQSGFPFTKHSINISGVVHSDNNGRDMTRLKALNEKKEQIEQFVNSIPDLITKSIFEIKYIEGDVKRSWDDVADIIGGGNTADSVRMVAKRFLIKIAKK